MNELQQPNVVIEAKIGATPMGDTPIERIRLLIDGKRRNAFLKLESHNPGGSVKDRTAFGLLQSLETTGQLRAGGRILESSSGNLAISLAMLARDRGYQFTAVVDPTMTAENMRRLHALGAETRIREMGMGARTVAAKMTCSAK